MKQLFFILSLFPIIAFGQQTKDTVRKAGISNIEKFLISSGTLLRMEYIDIGTITGISSSIFMKANNCKIQTEIVTDLINNVTIKGVRLESHEIGNSITEGIGYLDADEIDATMKAIKIIQTTILVENVDHFTEVVFRSRGGFYFCCNSKGQKWNIFIDVSNNNDATGTIVTLNENEVNKLYSYLQLAKNRL